MRLLFGSILLLAAFCDPPAYDYNFVHSDASGLLKKSSDYAYVRQVSKKSTNISFLYHVVNTSREEAKVDYLQQKVTVGNIPFKLVRANKNSYDEPELYYYPQEGINKEIILKPGDTLRLRFLYQADTTELTQEDFMELSKDTLTVQLETGALTFTSKGILAKGMY